MLQNAHTSLVGKRYALRERLGQGSMGAVYRAVDRLTGQQVALKRVIPIAESAFANLHTETAAASVRVALAREFQTLASLHHPHVIQVLDYGFDDGQMPYFTMTLLDEPRPFLEAASGQSVTTKIRLLIEMLQALAYLHRRGVVHCDLKPDNALVTKEAEVKVLDFGLASLRGQSRDEEEIAGTLAYMAPEILQGQQPSVASDLYAVGVMAYELFVGEHPFDLSNTMNLINNTLFTPIIVPHVDLEVAVGDILERLLSKTPDARYTNAYEVIEHLSRAIDQPTPHETAAIRESFLQSAQFVGRDAELKELTNALKEAIASRGSAWLIGGESGVGKSRLMDELRTRALVQGALVLRGQGVSGGGLPYQFWREPLRRLVLAMEIDELEAGILKDLIPDIEHLLERTIPDPIPLDGSAYQQRLFAMIVSIFRRYGQPMLLLLEDLQWGLESLDILTSLYASIDELPLMIVGSFRYEDRPNLPDELAGMRYIRLERLSAEGIAALSASMIGEAGQQPEVLELLTTETEGNVYFVVEVVRALAEEAGRLSNIASMSLPRHVFVGGMRQVIARRLNRLPESDRPMLALAACLGRELDLSVLDKLRGDVEIEDWLTTCANCAILEVQDGQWRFAHDKLRQGVLDEMDAKDRADLHRRVAEAIEAVYPYSPEHAAILADHWHDAGNHDRELEYTRAAGQHALHVSALHEAISHFERALELLKHTSLTEEDIKDMRADLLLHLSEALKNSGSFSRANEVARQALELHRENKNESGEAQALLELGEVTAQQGEWLAAIDLLDQSLALFRKLKNQARTARAINQLGFAYTNRGDYARAMELYQESLTLSRAIRDVQETASTANNMGVAAFRQGDLEAAARHFGETLDISRTSGERRKMVTALVNLGSVSGAGGNLEGAKRYFEEALDTARAIGERRIVALAMDNLGVVANMLQQYDLAHSYFEESLEMAHAMGNQQAIAWTLKNLGDVASAQNDIDSAQNYYTDAARQARTINATPTLLESLVSIAQVTRNPYRALEILAVIRNHTAATAATKTQVDTALEKVKEKLAAQEYENGLNKPRDLEALLDEILDQVT